MTLAVHTFGPQSGRPLLALHGMRAHGARFRPIAERLPEFRVSAPDLRGHGTSPWDGPWTLEQAAEDVLATLDAAGIERTAVVGHSWGGAVAVYLARLAPDRVTRLVLLDAGLGIPPTVAARYAAEFDVDTFGNPADAAESRAATWPPVPPELVAAEVADHLFEGEDGRWRWRYSPEVVALFAESARPPVSPPAEVPTVAVIAKIRKGGEPEYLPVFREALGDNLTEAWFDCGHVVYLEKPDETANVIRG